MPDVPDDPAGAPSSAAPASTTASDTKACPLCGETIKLAAIRCKHCHADLSAIPQADFDRGASISAAVAKEPAKPSAAAPTTPPKTDDEFEQRFLDFAYETDERLTAISVAHGLKVPIAVADTRLESLAASDVIHRDVDDEGGVFYSLPGRRNRGAGVALVSTRGASAQVQLVVPRPAPTETAAMTGLILNLVMPGVGSIVAGKPGPGIAQIALVTVGLPLCLVFVGFPVVFAAWVWSLMTANTALREAREAELSTKQL